jgi:phenylacetate-CoA ligase
MQRLAEIALNICWKHLTFYFGPSYHRQLSRRFFVSTLRRAKRKIPYYIDALEEFEFDDQTIDNDTVRSIPIIDRDIIIANYPDNLVDPRVKKEDLITTTTSGTSGFPLSFAYGKETHAHRLAVYMRSLTILGYRPWHKVAYLFSRQAVPIYNFGPLFQFIHISSLTEVADQVAEIREKKPDILIGFSSHVLRMAQHCQENAISLRFKFVSVNSEHISETERMFVSEVFHCPVYQSYGSEETWMIASTCRENNWHIFTDNVFLEIVDADGNSVDDGVRGDVLVTTLNTPAMPLIRYRLGDIVMGKSGRCSCGSPFPMLASFEGRSVDRFHP